MKYDDKLQHPSLPLAYDLATKSYDWMLKRADAWDGNLDKILTWGTSVNAGIVAIVLNGHKDAPLPNLITGWFWVALCVFATAIIIGFVGKFQGKIVLANPNNYCDDAWTTLPEDRFRRRIIEDCGKHFRQNNNCVNMKAMLANQTTVLFIIVAILNVVWAIKL